MRAFFAKGCAVERFLKLCALCTAGLAQASGFYLVDNGAKAMVQGGAFTAQADDGTAMQYNPAGLAKQSGFSFLADVEVLRHDVTFSRQDVGFDVNNPSTVAETVSNEKTPFLLPFFAVSYGFPLAGRTLTVGLGLFAPPSQGEYVYPTPDYTKDGNNFVHSPKKFAPQRYALINTNILIAYPTLSLAYDIHPRFQVGVSAQLTLSRFKQKQTLYGGDALCPAPPTPCLGDLNPDKQLQENPNYDVTAEIDLPGQVGFTGILGLMARPTDWLSIGASIRPPIPFKATGKLNVELSPYFKEAGATLEGDQATLQMTLPLEIRLGARVTPIRNLGVNFDFVYFGWNSVDQFLLTPQNLMLSAAPGAEPSPVHAFGLKKNWMPAWSLRLGGTYKIIEYLSVHAGALYETQAAPTATYSVDWTHPARFMFTGGVTGHLGPIDVIAGALFTPTTTTVVTDSIVVRGQTRDDITPPAVGNGVYTSGAWGLIFGVRGHFGDAPPAAQPTQVSSR